MLICCRPDPQMQTSMEVLKYEIQNARHRNVVCKMTIIVLLPECANISFMRIQTHVSDNLIPQLLE